MMKENIFVVRIVIAPAPSTSFPGSLIFLSIRSERGEERWESLGTRLLLLLFTVRETFNLGGDILADTSCLKLSPIQMSLFVCLVGL